MLTLKSGSRFISNMSRFALSRQIYLSCRKQVDSDEWRTHLTNNNTGGTTPLTVGVEKTINSVTLLGRVGSNPVKRGSLEHPVVTFSLATNSNYSYPNGDVNQKTEWHRICVFKPYLRDSILKYTNKGQRVFVQGRIIYGEVKEPEGNLRYTCSIVADDVIYFRNNS
ncbi:single-stranded DNA-binding protein, mitochondrial-like [Daphnia pulicaria]|uniref:single-stranded DNA-binding protein, mitochondrial-like n=1 Tax=Daphnia pulicaria TaxID=35523 RepID=UPI001EEA1EE8|nr:single-stranded DNA-binding protein, mitochondrial-like [Daphnia pulicaria]